MFVSPDGIPFYGGTYFPPVGRYNLPSFTDVLNFLTNTWQNEQDKVAKQSASLIEYLKDNARQEPGGTTDDLGFHGEDQARKLFENNYDSLHYGFKFQPQNKFPPSMGLSLLLRQYHRTGDALSLQMAEHTLKAMKNGGIYDQIGGGLSRYSTDYQWLVPHFEKMLYDNALFVTALIETYQATGKDEFAEYTNDVLQYIDRDMTSADGAFYSAEDADSEGVEGKFYVWTQEEIEQILDRKTASIALPYYNVTPSGNWEKHTILNITRHPEQLAGDLALPLDTVQHAIARARDQLLAVRSRRIRPLLDDKVLTSWNGLMIAAMAKAGRVLEDPDRIEKAERALAFVWSHLHPEKGKLLRRYRDGDARYDGYLFDYTALAVASLELYEATYDHEYTDHAHELMQTVEKKFASDGAYFETADDAEDLIVRQISGYDGVEPAGNSSAALAFLKLAALSLETECTQRAEKIFTAFHDELSQYGLNSSYMMQALHLYLGGCKEVAIIGVRNGPSTEKMLRLIRRKFFPNAVFAFALEDDPQKNRVPLLADKKTIGGQATAYVCQQGSCLAPVTSPEELEKLLNNYGN